MLYYTPDNPIFQTSSEPTHCYVQLEAHYHSPMGSMLDAISVSKNLPYKIKDRNPRSSFEGWRGWGQKESAIVDYFLSTLTSLTPKSRFRVVESPSGDNILVKDEHASTSQQSSVVVARGNLKLPANASPTIHKAAKAKFSRYIKHGEKKLGRVIRFRAVAHHSDPTNRHYDFVVYTINVSFSRLRHIVRSAAEVSGFKATCRRIRTPGERKSSVRYIHKCELQPVTGERYVFLPAKDGSRLVWGSKDFFQGRKKTDIWEECKKLWFGPITNSKQIDNKPPDELHELESLQRTITAMLPTNPVAADIVRWGAAKLSWLLGWWLYNVETQLVKVPNIRMTKKGCYWRETTWDIPKPSSLVLVPYHRIYNSLPDEKLEDMLCEAETVITALAARYDAEYPIS
jgi:hypothetical protein